MQGCPQRGRSWLSRSEETNDTGVADPIGGAGAPGLLLERVLAISWSRASPSWAWGSKALLAGTTGNRPWPAQSRQVRKRMAVSRSTPLPPQVGQRRGPLRASGRRRGLGARPVSWPKLSGRSSRVLARLVWSGIGGKAKVCVHSLSQQCGGILSP